MSQMGVPEISVTEVAAKRSRGAGFLLVDVRESHELPLANLGEDVIHLPLSQLAQQREAAIPVVLQAKEEEIVVFCHHGMRSAQVVAFLRANGWSNVINMAGGIDAYAREVDPAIGFY